MSSKGCCGVPAAAGQNRHVLRRIWLLAYRIPPAVAPPRRLLDTTAPVIALLVLLLVAPSSTDGQAATHNNINGATQAAHHHIHQHRQHHAACMPRNFNHTLLAALLGTTAPRPFIGAFAASDAASGACGSGGSGGDGGGQRPGMGTGPDGADTSAAAADDALAMDPWAYALYNPQFGLWAGTLSKQMALMHYEREGSKAGYPVSCARIPVFISYPPRGGLCNMVFCNLEAWTIAVALGADVLLTTVHKRATFECKCGWADVPWRTLFHLNATAHMLGELGVRVAEDLAAAGNDTRRPVFNTTFVYEPQNWLPNGTTLYNNSQVPHDLHWLVPVLTQEVVAAARREQAARIQRGEAVRCDRPPAVHLHIHHTFGIMKRGSSPVATHLARGLRFSEPVEARAGLVASAMEAAGHAQYNGLHLRLEGDMHYGSWGNRSAAVEAHVDAIKRMGWDRPPPSPGTAGGTPPALAAPAPARLPVLIASGLFTYREGQKEYKRMVKLLAPFGSVFMHKEELEAQAVAAANATALPALDSEQAAAVDMLLLLRARQFVGAMGSSFSRFAAQKRVLDGRSGRDNALGGYWPTRAEWRFNSTLNLVKECWVASCVE